MAAYRRVYDSRHLQADCQEPGSARNPKLGNRLWATFAFLIVVGYYSVVVVVVTDLSISEWISVRDGHRSNLQDPTHFISDPTQPNIFRTNKTRPNPTQAIRIGTVQHYRTVLYQ